MNHPSERSLYFEALIRRNGATWLWAGLCALTLNAALFALMPHLLHLADQAPAYEKIISPINVVRIRQPESPVKRKAEPPPEPPPKRPLAEKTPRKPIKSRLTLPFELNPRLPSGPGTLTLPALPPAAVDVSGFDEAFLSDDLDDPLTVMARIPPIYPYQAKQRGIEGWVTVQFLVDEKGGVGRVSVKESRPPGVFEDSVIRCVSGWRFKPGRVEGIPVKTWAETTIRFELE